MNAVQVPFLSAYYNLRHSRCDNLQLNISLYSHPLTPNLVPPIVNVLQGVFPVLPSFRLFHATYLQHLPYLVFCAL